MSRKPPSGGLHREIDLPHTDEWEMRPRHDDRALPDFIIIGAMKCATTSLYYHLRGHPALEASFTKEPDFFANTAWDRGLDWYERQFPRGRTVRFEASTSYTKYPWCGPVAERMHRIVPHAKLIYVVRDPLERLISHFQHAIAHGRATPEEALSNDFWMRHGRHYLRCSLYHQQLSRFLPYFDLSRIRVVRFEDFVDRPVRLMNEILRFVGVEEEDLYAEGTTFRKYNDSAKVGLVASPLLYRLARRLQRLGVAAPIHLWFRGRVPRPRLRAEDEWRLWRIFSEDLARLETLTGMRFPYAPPTAEVSSRWEPSQAMLEAARLL